MFYKQQGLCSGSLQVGICSGIMTSDTANNRAHGKKKKETCSCHFSLVHVLQNSRINDPVYTTTYSVGRRSRPANYVFQGTLRGKVQGKTEQACDFRYCRFSLEQVIHATRYTWLIGISTFTNVCCDTYGGFRLGLPVACCNKRALSVCCGTDGRGTRFRRMLS